MRNRHERDERFRERMLAAADDYSTGVRQAMLLLNVARQAVLDEMMDSEAPPAAASVDAANARVDDVHTRIARVELLFGAENAAGVAAGAALESMRSVLSALRERPRPNLRDASDAFQAAHEAQRGFNRDALAAMRGSRLPSLRRAPNGQAPSE